MALRMKDRSRAACHTLCNDILFVASDARGDHFEAGLLVQEGLAHRFKGACRPLS